MDSGQILWVALVLLLVSVVLSFLAGMYFERTRKPEYRTASLESGRIPLIKRVPSKKTPVFSDEFKEWERELEELKKQGR